jgi:hypothetical protein
MMSLYIIYCTDKCYAYYVHFDMLCICDVLCIYEDLLEEIKYNTIQYLSSTDRGHTRAHARAQPTSF